LHYLFKTPFRYGAAYPSGSRFRRAGLTPGVYYASEQPRTAVAEMTFYRLLFFAESPQTPWPTNPSEYTDFSAALRTRRMLDLTAPPLDRDAAHWRRLTDYGPCRAFADVPRKAEAELIRYGSVRDPAGGANVAVLSCVAFAHVEPLENQTWWIGVGENGVYAIREFPPDRVEFGREAFAAYPRIAPMRWGRA
jgi:hypothetical protein